MLEENKRNGEGNEREKDRVFIYFINFFFSILYFLIFKLRINMYITSSFLASSNVVRINIS